MFCSCFLVFALFWISVTGRSVVIDKLIKLAFGASKAAYIPFDIVRQFTSGQIMEANGRGEYTPACVVGGWETTGSENHGTEVLHLVNHVQKIVIFAFRGTEPDIDDWRKNFKIWLTNVRLSGCGLFKVHKGFHDRYKTIQKWFETQYRAIPHDYQIVITGHSLGGALATVSAAYAGGAIERRPNAVITFASPKVGDKTFQKCYQSLVGCDRTRRVKTRNDIVTAVPIFKYTHVCGSLTIDRFTSNLLFNHGLSKGYQRGLRTKYGRNMTPVNFGCDRQI